MWYDFLLKLIFKKSSKESVFSGETINVKFNKISELQLEESFTGVIAAGLVHTYPEYKHNTITNYGSDGSDVKPPFIIEYELNHEFHLSLIHKDKLKAHVAYIPMKDQKTIYFRFNLMNSDIKSKSFSVHSILWGKSSPF